MDTTAHDLKLLSIGYFIQGGIVTGSGILMFGYVALMGAVFASVQSGGRANPQNHMPSELCVLGAIMLALAVVSLAVGIGMLYSGV
jgi:hypothetical protein